MSSFALLKSAHRGAGQTWSALRAAVRLTPQVLSVLALGVVLSVTLPAFLGYHTVTVVSGSMGDALPVGSVAVTKPVPAAAIQEGDVLAFSQPGAPLPVLHRVVAISEVNGQRVAATKGDANETGDATPLVLQGKGEVVMYHVPWLGYGLAFTQSLWGRLLLGITIGGSLIVSLAKNRGFHANARRAEA